MLADAWSRGAGMDWLPVCGSSGESSLGHPLRADFAHIRPGVAGSLYSGSRFVIDPGELGSVWRRLAESLVVDTFRGRLSGILALSDALTDYATGYFKGSHSQNIRLSRH